MPRHLDLLSTSQTHPPRCVYGAPLVAVRYGDQAYIKQSCCNHWDCPLCGETRAKQEYRRIVEGCHQLAEMHQLYFWTLTCRGREIPLELAEENYYAWTNVLLTNARTKSNRAGQYWCYVQVTERQKKTRRHPHSHLLTTFLPNDAQETTDRKGRACYASRWFSEANASAGLGTEHNISIVRTPDAVSRYVAKYLFKDTSRDVFPPKWKRIRYSKNFPKLPEMKPDWSTALLTPKDWRSVERQRVTFKCDDLVTYTIASNHTINIAI